MTGVEFAQLVREAERHEAETWADACFLQFGPIRFEPVTLALAAAGRVRRNYWRTASGFYMGDATVLPRSMARR